MLYHGYTSKHLKNTIRFLRFYPLNSIGSAILMYNKRTILYVYKTDKQCIGSTKAVLVRRTYIHIIGVIQYITVDTLLVVKLIL